MNLVIKYSIKPTDTVAIPVTTQFSNDTTDQGNQGINFKSAEVSTTMVVTNPTQTNNSHKGSILPSTNNISDGTYVDKIIAVTMPLTIDGTTYNYLSVTLNKIGINSDIIGIEPLGLTKAEVVGTNAAFLRHSTMLNSLIFSVSEGKLIIVIPKKSPYLETITTEAAIADPAGNAANQIGTYINTFRKSVATEFQGLTLNLRITYKN